jgi:hemerythrin superfamily protein
MQSANPQTKREGIASGIADIKARQAMIVLFDDWLLSQVDDADFRDDIRKLVDEDDKNYKLIETVEINHGLRAQPKPATLDHIELARRILQGSEYSFLEKIAEYGFLKQMQIACGNIVHKVAQVSEPDVKLAVGPMAAVNADNISHAKKATAMMEVIGTYQIAGEALEQGLWARIKDTFAVATGGIAGGMVRPIEDMPITSVLAIDHRKVSALFKEIKSAADSQTAQERFLQLYSDLNSHTLAEEETFYETLRTRGMRADIDHAQGEHVRMKSLLERIRSSSPSTSNFTTMVDELEALVKHHVDKEEDEIFDMAKEQFTENELVLLSRRFKEAKMRVQEELAQRGIGRYMPLQPQDFGDFRSSAAH